MISRELSTILEGRHGLRVDDLTELRLDRALREEAERTGTEPGAAAAQIALDPRLQQRLIDTVTLQETSFFRDPPLWEDLAADVLPAALQAATGGPLTVWSAGCANGQEAWSLAMLLRELGARRFEVVASDLSATAARRASAGVYEERELRGLSRARVERWMRRDGDRWRVADELRPHVRVVHQNVTSGVPPVADGSCALVLCRYVLIYLTPGAAEDLLGRIAAALGPEGRLVIGAAESLWHLTEAFVAAPLPQAVAYRPRPADAAARPASTTTPPLRPEEPAQPPRHVAPRTAHLDTGERTPPTVGAPDAAGLAHDGEVAAARGDLVAAAAAFRGAAYLDPDDAVALTRLGLVLEAMGDPGALRAFRAARAALGRRPAGAPEPSLGGFDAESLDHLLREKLS